MNLSLLYLFLTLWLGVINPIGLLVLGFDKLAAVAGWSRVPERTLHRFEWMGGAICMFPALYLFCHKSSKKGYWVKSILPFVVWVVLMALVYAASNGSVFA